jgi:hypothetical protein
MHEPDARTECSGPQKGRGRAGVLVEQETQFYREYVDTPDTPPRITARSPDGYGITGIAKTERRDGYEITKTDEACMLRAAAVTMVVSPCDYKDKNPKP